MSFIIRRLGTALITLFLVSVLGFFAFGVIPGDPASLILGTEANPEQLAALREELGLDRSLPQRYLDWLLRFFTGDLGNSIRFGNMTVSGMIGDRLPVSAFLAGLSLFFIGVIAVPVSLVSVRREGGFADRAVNVLAAAGVGVPGFFLGVFFIWIFGIGLHLFTPGAYIDYRKDFAGFFLCLCFPALAIALPNAAVLAKFLRSAVFAELKNDYTRTARSKGAGYSLVLRRHVLRNALVPAIAVFAMIIAEVFSGSIVIEQVFAVPGMGRLLVAAIGSRDYPLIQALVMYTACLVIAANTLADMVIQIIDPRIRLVNESSGSFDLRLRKSGDSE